MEVFISSARITCAARSGLHATSEHSAVVLYSLATKTNAPFYQFPTLSFYILYMGKRWTTRSFNQTIHLLLSSSWAIIHTWRFPEDRASNLSHEEHLAKVESMVVPPIMAMLCRMSVTSKRRTLCSPTVTPRRPKFGTQTANPVGSSALDRFT